MSTNYKDTLHLPKTDFPMKADLVKREPERLENWEARACTRRSRRRARTPALRAARRAALCQRRCPHGHGAEQGAQGSDREIEHDGRLSRAVHPGLGLPRAADRVQGGEGIARPLAGRGAPEKRGIRAQIHRHPAEAVQAARRVRRLGASVPHARSGLRGGDHPRVCEVRGEGARLSVEEAGLLEHRRADRAGRGGGGVYAAHGPGDLCEISRIGHRRSSRLAAQQCAKPLVIWTTTPWTLPANVAIAVSAAGIRVAGRSRHAGPRNAFGSSPALLENFVQRDGNPSRCAKSARSVTRRATRRRWKRSILS